MQLDKIDFSNGVWRGLLTASQAGPTPSMRVELNGEAIDGCAVSGGPTDREWIIEISVPKDAVGDGVFTFSIFVNDSIAPDCSFCISGGRAMEYDLQAEVALLRDELEILKRAFRRHIHNAG